MPDYIDRELLYKDRKLLSHDGINYFLELDIKSAQSVDVACVEHGHWIDVKVVKNNPTVKCSVCSMQFCDTINNHKYMYRFCPYCGAKMDEVIE